jgi:predicted amidohydrolase
MKRMVVALWSVPTQGMQNISLDARRAALKQAVDKAYQVGTQKLASLDSSAMHSPPYGVFATPEYFIAQPIPQSLLLPTVRASHTVGDQRHIDEDEKERRLAEFKEISRLAKGWIIVPGTIAWRKPFQRAGAKMYHSKGSKMGQLKAESRYDKAVTQIEDYAKQMNMLASTGLSGKMNLPSDHPLVRSGFATTVSAPTTQTKVSSLKASKDGDMLDLRPIHMARNTAYVLYDGDVKFKYNKRGDYHEVLDGGNTVHVPGAFDGRFQLRTSGPNAVNERPIEFSIEICLDHVLNTAAREVQHYGGVDIQIITSAWVKPDEGSLSLKSGGYLAHACSNAEHTAVSKFSKGTLWNSFTSDKPFATETVSGCPLRFWTIELDLTRMHG